MFAHSNLIAILILATFVSPAYCRLLIIKGVYCEYLSSHFSCPYTLVQTGHSYRNTMRQLLVLALLVFAVTVHCKELEERKVASAI